MYNIKIKCKGELCMTFGERLKLLRDEGGLTQQDIADIINVGRPTIAGYETKGKQPDYDKLKTLANYFDVSVDYLIGNTDIRKLGPRRIYSASELVDILPEEYKELFKEQNLGYIKFAKEMMKEEIDPEDLIQLIRVAQNFRKEIDEKNKDNK